MADADNSAAKVRGRPFKSGAEWNGNAKGRPQGARNRFGELFLQKLIASMEAGGDETIERVRLERPDVWLRCMVQILPKEMVLKREDALDDMSDDELHQLIA